MLYFSISNLIQIKALNYFHLSPLSKHNKDVGLNLKGSWELLLCVWIVPMFGRTAFSILICSLVSTLQSHVWIVQIFKSFRTYSGLNSPISFPHIILDIYYLENQGLEGWLGWWAFYLLSTASEFSLEEFMLNKKTTKKHFGSYVSIISGAAETEADKPLGLTGWPT